MSIPAAVVLGSTIILGLMLIAGFYLQVHAHARAGPRSQMPASAAHLAC